MWDAHDGPRQLNFLKIEMEGAYMIKDPFKKRVRFWEKLNIPDTPSESDILLN